MNKVIPTRDDLNELGEMQKKIEEMQRRVKGHKEFFDCTLDVSHDLYRLHTAAKSIIALHEFEERERNDHICKR